MEKIIEVGHAQKIEASNIYNIHVTGNPLEIAKALNDIRKKHKLTYRELVELTPFSLSQIAKYLSLLKLETDFQEKLETREMAWSTGYVLAQLPPKNRTQFLDPDIKRIRLVDAETAKREHDLSQMQGLFQDIETITKGIETNDKKTTCPKCGHHFSAQSTT